MRFFARSRRAVAREGTARRGRALSASPFLALAGCTWRLRPDSEVEPLELATRDVLIERLAARRVRRVLLVLIIVAVVVLYAQMAMGS